MRKIEEFNCRSADNLGSENEIPLRATPIQANYKH